MKPATTRILGTAFRCGTTARSTVVVKAESVAKVTAVACFAFIVAASAAWSSRANGQTLLDGEFGRIDLGRELIETDRLPTVTELRALVANPRMQSVLMFKLYGDANNHSLPVWSEDGRRLAFQRTDTSRDLSKLLVYDSLAQAEPTMISDGDDYDYAFQWAIHGDGAFTFARIEGADRSSRIMASVAGEPPAPRTARGKYYAPSLYARTDGIWRLAYENSGTITHEAWSEYESVSPPLALMPGASPTWTQDGFHLVVARGLPGQASLGTHEIAIRSLTNDSETAIPATTGESVRSPVLSPDESQVAYFARSSGQRAAWSIRVASLADRNSRKVADDVLVNAEFNSQGPCWEPTGERIWCFTNANRQQAYFPLTAVATSGGAATTVDYPRRCTSPNDLAVNPATRIPELAFVGRLGATQDLVILLLNHY